ncbi:MAG TPA: hypothetical protein VLC46_26080 [Thermoanaerobaculia bacterium]|jgi:hypothetical protein|nr:hypothetical protein [Thermoanaerobaculia bacterium]
MLNLLSISSLLLLVAPLFILVLAVAVRSRVLLPAGPRLLVLLYLVPALTPIAISLIWRIPATRIVIELRGLAFRAPEGETLRKPVTERTAGSGRLLIGEVSTRRHTQPSSFGTLVFRPHTAQGDEKGMLTVELPPPQARAGLISVEGQGLLGAVALEDHDQICIQSDCWTFNLAGKSFSNGAATVQIPSRQAKLPGIDWSFTLPWAPAITAGSRTYSLDALATPNSGPQSSRIRSFLCYANPGPRLRLVPLDAGVRLMRGGSAVTADATAGVADGQHIAIYSCPAQTPGFENPGIVERRGMTYRAGKRSFALEFDTPEVHSLTVSELDALRIATGDDTKAKVVGLSMGDAQMTERGLYFSGASESVAVQASSSLELSRFFPRDFQPDFRIVSPRGPTDATFGHDAWIGATDLAAFRMQVFQPPLLLLLIGLVLQLAKVVAAYAGRFTNGQALVAGALETLVAIRLLVGYRIWAMPPHVLAGAELGILAWIALPWIFLAASVSVTPLQRRERLGGVLTAPWLPAMAGLVFSAVCCVRLNGGARGLVWVACHVLAAGVALVRLPAVRTRLIDGSKRLMDRAVPLARYAGPFGDPEILPLLLAAAAFSVIRIALVLFGFKESIPIGGARGSLSALHVPAAAILEGIFLWTVRRRMARDRRLRGSDVAAAIILMVLVWFIPAVVASDIGLALLNVPVFAFLWLGCVRGAGERKTMDRRQRILRLIPAVLVAGIVVVIGVAPAWRLVMPLLGNEESMLERASDANFARLIHFAEPDRLRELATKRGESLAVTSAILQRYISTGLTGRGYGRSEMSPQLGDTALRDFAPAVFIAAEWGLAGTLAMIVLYLGFLMAGRTVAPWRWPDQAAPARSPAGAMAYVAAATIAIASIYMILANHELLLLTGKNAYLLGLDSAGDILETIFLLLVIAFGFAAIRSDETRSLTLTVPKSLVVQERNP